MVWGWVVVGKETFFQVESQRFTLHLAFFTMLIGLAMAGECN